MDRQEKKTKKTKVPNEHGGAGGGRRADRGARARGELGDDVRLHERARQLQRRVQRERRRGQVAGVAVDCAEGPHTNVL